MYFEPRGNEYIVDYNCDDVEKQQYETVTMETFICKLHEQDEINIKIFDYEGLNKAFMFKIVRAPIARATRLSTPVFVEDKPGVIQ